MSENMSGIKKKNERKELEMKKRPLGTKTTKGNIESRKRSSAAKNNKRELSGSKKMKKNPSGMKIIKGKY
jgi:hypothetical protein